MADESAADGLFERLRLHQQRSPDSSEVARAIVARINTRLTSHDKNIRQTTLEKLWNKQSGAMQMLLTILDTSRDTATCNYITSILRETLCLKQGKGKKCSEKVPTGEQSTGKKKNGTCKSNNKKSGKENVLQPVSNANNRARQACLELFIIINGTQVALRSLVALQSKRDSSVQSELMLLDLVWMLAAVAPKDPKFATKVRSLGCVRTLHLILKGHFTDNKLVFPLLVIMKQLAKNCVTTSILIRDGVVATYERVLVSLGFIPTARLRLCLDAIDYLSKNKVCCMQIVKTGLSTALLRVFDRWDRYEGRMRLKICAHILQTLQHLCNIKFGRRALCTKKHVQILHRFCSQCPDEPEFDGLLARVCSVITLCLKHQTLPVPATSPASLNLSPILKGTNTVWPCHEDEDGANSDSKTVNSDLDDDSPDVDLEGVEEFPDFEPEEGELKQENSLEDTEKIVLKSQDSMQSSLWIYPNERDIEDLKKYVPTKEVQKYFIFFKEFGSYNKQLKLVKSRSNSRGSILEDFLCNQPGKPINSSLNLWINNTSDADPNSSGAGSSSPPQSSFYKIHETTSTTSCSSLKILKDISKYRASSSVYCTIASRVKSVIPFVKVAYPDMTGGLSHNYPEPLYKMERIACRNKLLSCVDRAINPEAYMSEVVYDLDVLNSNNTSDGTPQKSSMMDNQFLANNDEEDLSKMTGFSTRLAFESRFESGNLRKAIQVGPREYELILMPDVNSNKRHQWFYFEVRNMQQGRPYIFNIVNCEKSDSQFNFGMKPVMYSVKEAICGRAGWVRAGSDICYYRNSYHYANQKNHNKCYLTVTFNIDFPHSNDICYVAYHFPYTFSMMMTRIWQWSLNMPSGAYLRAEPLCYSLNNNEVPLLTVTAEDTPTNPVVDREIVFLTARVHPGESNASWVMDGTLGCLLGSAPTAAALRAKYVFKIVPMLNVEGVINGCHRCGLTNEDLNRRWCKPSPVLHPSIYHTKGLIEYLVRVWKKPPSVYCDYHGHSRKKNVFFYGCASAESWCTNDRLVQDEPVKYLMLPALMHRISPAFALGSCSFRVERERESTARVTVWRHLGVTRSYTMEASFCGFDRGPFKGFHLNTQHLRNVGSDFCEALNGLTESTSVDLHITKDINGPMTKSMSRTIERLNALMSSSASSSTHTSSSTTMPSSSTSTQSSFASSRSSSTTTATTSTSIHSSTSLPALKETPSVLSSSITASAKEQSIASNLPTTSSITSRIVSEKASSTESSSLISPVTKSDSLSASSEASLIKSPAKVSPTASASTSTSDSVKASPTVSDPTPESTVTSEDAPPFISASLSAPEKTTSTNSDLAKSASLIESQTASEKARLLAASDSLSKSSLKLISGSEKEQQTAFYSQPESSSRSTIVSASSSSSSIYSSCRCSSPSMCRSSSTELAVDSEAGSGSDSILKTDSDEDFD